MSVKAWWNNLNGAVRIAFYSVGVLVFISGGVFAARDRSWVLPAGNEARIEALETVDIRQDSSIVSIDHRLERIEGKQDRDGLRLQRIICLVEEELTALACERLYGTGAN